VILLLLSVGAAANTLMLSTLANADDEIKAIADNKIAAVFILFVMTVRFLVVVSFCHGECLD
jgi:hypothetical protein